MIIKGKVHKFGNNINTDDIIAAKYLVTTDIKELGRHCLEHIRPGFSSGVKKGEIIVAGKNFGCGSSREHAPLSIKGCGIKAVVAKSFATIFFRNAINIGLPVLELKEADQINEGDLLEIDLVRGIIRNVNEDRVYRIEPFPGFIQGIIRAGGLMNYIKNRNR
jgi:3-isopropylmalate/(R)-2-methylmalate dehydratase small subunit